MSFLDIFPVPVSNGYRTEWSPILSVNKIGRLHSGSAISLPLV